MSWVIAQPGTAWAVVILLVLALAIGAVLVAMSRRVLIAPGQIATSTLAARVPVEVTDPIATEAERQAERKNAPKVYVGDAARLDDLASAIENLPAALADAPSLDKVRESIRSRFSLTESSLKLIASQTTDDKPNANWVRRAKRFAEVLRTTPLVDNETFQQQSLSPTDRVELVIEGQPSLNLRSAELLNTDSRRLEQELRMRAAGAGFGGEEIDAVVSPILSGLRPTYRIDRAMSQARADAAAAAVIPRGLRFTPGELIYTRGQTVTPAQLELARAEATAWWRTAPAHQRLAETGSLLALGLLIALGLGAYVSTYAPQLLTRPRRMASLAMLLIGALGLACVIVLIDARAAVAAACVPAAMVAAVLVVAYERRTALALGSLIGLACALAVRLPLEAIVVPLTSAGVIVWQLREIRHRGTLIKAGVIAGLLTSAITLLIAQMSLPLSESAIAQMVFGAAAAGLGVLMACFVVLGLLPTIERSFGVLTPLTLIELRDPRHPLLQRLQQRAPGTWVHSMNVANLTEQACQAIGADGLLAHVGALYHDVGKMNRPEMFVENQAGINRHDKLSPAMSLLLIVAHVADGIEMAREARLPQPLWHFIEAHHGTTIVEYFYHRARKQHDEACKQTGVKQPGEPDEKQYRYPGPKPRTKEAAVMMICDAAEGAARAMPEPTAIKIELMVRAIADKRLHDGQFDECELTMKELATIVQTVSRNLASVHHGRIAYPEARERKAPPVIVAQG